MEQQRPTDANGRSIPNRADHDAGHKHTGSLGLNRWERLGAALAKHKVWTGVGAFIALTLIFHAVDPNPGNGGAHPAPTPTAAAAATTTNAPRPTSAASTTAARSRPTASHKLNFPPKTLVAFRTFAATGDASQIHKIATSSEGLPSCPEPDIFVTVNPALTARTLEADLSAYFVQSGLIGNRCQAFLFAYHSRHDYRAHLNDGFTVGSVALTDIGSGSQFNLEVDVGEVTSEVNNLRSRFEFNF